MMYLTQKIELKFTHSIINYSTGIKKYILT